MPNYYMVEGRCFQQGLKVLIRKASIHAVVHPRIQLVDKVFYI